MATPVFKYKLPTVGTLNDLFADYPDGGQYGMFAYISTQSKYAWWNHTLSTPQWELTTETPVTPQGGIPTGPDKVELSDFAILKYLKDPVADINELYTRYLNGGEHGWFMIVTSLNAFAWWNDTIEPAQWYILGGGTGGGTGGGISYTNTIPVPTTVGGITQGTTFNAKTMQEMWDALLYPDTPPTVTNPEYYITNSRGNTFEEVGASLEFTFGNDFRRGVINPLWVQNPETDLWEAIANEPRVGVPSYTGVENGIKVIVLNANTWQRTATFAQGAQPRTSKGNIHLTPYPAEAAEGTLTASVTVMGVYPIYATTVNMSEPLNKLTLQSHGSAIEVKLASEVGGKQKIKIPRSIVIEGTTHVFWIIKKIYFLDPNDVWQLIEDSAVQNFVNFDKTNEVINGVTYDVLTHKGVLTASRKLKFTV